MAGEYRWHLQKQILVRRSNALKIKLGGVCVQCGETDLDELEFHHPHGKNWRSRDVSRFERLRRYEQDAAAGLVELLCDDCHNYPEEHPEYCFCPHCRGDSVPDF